MSFSLLKNYPLRQSEEECRVQGHQASTQTGDPRWPLPLLMPAGASALRDAPFPTGWRFLREDRPFGSPAWLRICWRFVPEISLGVHSVLNDNRAGTADMLNNVDLWTAMRRWVDQRAGGGDDGVLLPPCWLLFYGGGLPFS